MPRPSEISAELLELARECSELTDWRGRALEQIGRLLPFHAAAFHEFSPRSPMSRAALVGIEADCLASNVSEWDEMAVTFGALVADAMAHRGVASPRRAFSPRSAAHKAWRRRIAAPLGLKDLAAIHLVVKGRVISAVILGRRRGQPFFSEQELKQLEPIALALAVGDALQQADGSNRGMQTSLHCVDLRLTERQREIVESVALGYTNRDIAAALELSPNTVRNHLVAVSQKLQASSRAEIVFRAVFR